MRNNGFKLVFISNYYNHHQKYLSDEFYMLTNNNYYFIETQPIDEERLSMGWGGEVKPKYVKQNYTSEKDALVCQTIINNADVVIIGSAPEILLENRKKLGKLIFRYSERPLKKGNEIYKFPYRWLIWHIRNMKSKNIYMLCASAYTMADYEKFGLFQNKCYKWGYFPEVKRYKDIDRLIEGKHLGSILWVARLIEWKHPELPIKVAKRLKNEGYSFNMKLIGNGKLEENLHNMICEYGLQDCVHMLGSMKPEQIRKYMEQSQIYLFTSDRNEGWGAVLNESMNSGCAVVASHAIGSVPFLLKDGQNGLIYKDGDEEDLYRKVKRLLDNQILCYEYGKQAYKTMNELWNAKTAAECFINLAEHILAGEKRTNLYESGPCSKAEILKDNWYKEEKN